MGRYGIGFNSQGKFTTFPSVFTTINAEELDLRNQGPTGILAVVGPGAGFLPPKVATALPFDIGTPSRFFSPGDLVDALNFAVRPFAEFNRTPGSIYVVPATPATAATKAINNGSAQLLCTLTALLWGLGGNSIKVKSEAGKLTVSLTLASGSLVQEVYSYATVADLVAQINGRSGLVSAVFTLEGTPATFSDTNMTGGTEPAVTNTDWSDSLNALAGIRCNAITVVTDSDTIHTMLKDYVTLKRTRGFVGGLAQTWGSVGARQTSIAALKAAAAALNSPRMMHCGLGAEGKAPYVFAARYAAMAAALDPSVPMTQKHLDVSSLEARLDIDTEVGPVDGLLINGVAVPVPDPSAPATFLVSRGLSTWTGDDNLYRREHSVLAAIDSLQFELEDKLREFLGGEGTPATAGRIRERVDAILAAATSPASSTRINGYDRDSIVVTFTSDTVARVSARVTPIPPVNFIAATLQLERTDITITTDVNLAG